MAARAGASRASTEASGRLRCSTCCSATPCSSTSTRRRSICCSRPGAERSSAMLRTEPAFVHVADDAAAPSESRYAVLFQADQRVTNDPDLRIGDYIARHARLLEQSLLPEHLTALDRLATLSTARLERLFAEHIDTRELPPRRVEDGPDRPRAAAATRAAAQVANDGAAAGVSTGGVYLGAYGWVEQLRPEGKNLQPVELPADLARRDQRPRHGAAAEGPDQPRADPHAVHQPCRHGGGPAQRARRPQRRDLRQHLLAACAVCARDPRGDARRAIARRAARIRVRAARARQRAADGARARLSACAASIRSSPTRSRRRRRRTATRRSRSPP